MLVDPLREVECSESHGVIVEELDAGSALFVRNDSSRLSLEGAVPCVWPFAAAIRILRLAGPEHLYRVERHVSRQQRPAAGR
jgi:hypothetical protein